MCPISAPKILRVLTALLNYMHLIIYSPAHSPIYGYDDQPEVCGCVSSQLSNWILSEQF